MNKQQYRAARRMVRDNGRFSLRWMPADQAAVMDRLDMEARSTDPLAERADIIAYCAREGIACNVRHTAPRPVAKACVGLMGSNGIDRPSEEPTAIEIGDDVACDSGAGERIVRESAFWPQYEF
ncbi:TPA: hypothetical protein ACK3Q6_004494 [Burkholderia cepacia]